MPKTRSKYKKNEKIASPTSNNEEEEPHNTKKKGKKDKETSSTPSKVDASDDSRPKHTNAEETRNQESDEQITDNVPICPTTTIMTPTSLAAATLSTPSTTFIRTATTSSVAFTFPLVASTVSSLKSTNKSVNLPTIQPMPVRNRESVLRLYVGIGELEAHILPASNFQSHVTRVNSVTVGTTSMSTSNPVITSQADHTPPPVRMSVIVPLRMETSKGKEQPLARPTECLLQNRDVSFELSSSQKDESTSAKKIDQILDEAPDISEISSPKRPEQIIPKSSPFDLLENSPKLPEVPDKKSPSPSSSSEKYESTAELHDEKSSLSSSREDETTPTIMSEKSPSTTPSLPSPSYTTIHTYRYTNNS